MRQVIYLSAVVWTYGRSTRSPRPGDKKQITSRDVSFQPEGRKGLSRPVEMEYLALQTIPTSAHIWPTETYLTENWNSFHNYFGGVNLVWPY